MAQLHNLSRYLMQFRANHSVTGPFDLSTKENVGPEMTSFQFPFSVEDESTHFLRSVENISVSMSS